MDRLRVRPPSSSPLAEKLTNVEGAATFSPKRPSSSSTARSSPSSTGNGLSSLRSSFSSWVRWCVRWLSALLHRYVLRRELTRSWRNRNVDVLIFGRAFAGPSPPISPARDATDADSLHRLRCCRNLRLLPLHHRRSDPPRGPAEALRASRFLPRLLATVLISCVYQGLFGGVFALASVIGPLVRSSAPPQRVRDSD